MTYFAILGKNIDISLRELDLVNPFDISFKGRFTIFFETTSPELLPQIGGITKFGELVLFSDLNLEGVKLLGANNDKIASTLKKQFGIKRYKLTDIVKTDLDIKTSGTELICFDEKFHDNTLIGLVKGYQNIPMLEEIDFGKPGRGMEIGMMPAKLTQIMINIGVSTIENSSKKESITIFDPFAGFGTTGFVANALGYDFIGSDINITPLKSNIKRWESNKFNPGKKFTIFKHDINEEFSKNFLNNVDVIVTEGWLGPVIKYDVQEKQFQENMQKISQVYKNFIVNVDKFYKNIGLCLTVPVYMDKPNYMKDFLAKLFEELNFKCEFVEEIYKRKDQKIGRQIVVASKR